MYRQYTLTFGVTMRQSIHFGMVYVFILVSYAYSSDFDTEKIKEEIQKTCEKKVVEREGRLSLNGLESCMKYELKSLYVISNIMKELSENHAAAKIALNGCLRLQMKKGKDLDYSKLSYCIKSQQEALHIIKTALQDPKTKDQVETCFLKSIEKEYTKDEVFYHTKRCLMKDDNLLVLKDLNNLSKIVFSNILPSKTDPSHSQILAPALPQSGPNSNQVMVSRSIATTRECPDQQKVKEDFYFSCRGLYAMAMEEKRQNYDSEKAGQICKCILSKQRDIASESCKIDKEAIKKLLEDKNLVDMCETSKSI